MPDRFRFGVAPAVVAISCSTANVGVVAIIASKACVTSIGDWRFGDTARWEVDKFRC
jgi:phosphatidylserine synthase